MLRLEVAVFTIEHSRDDFVAALLSTSHLTADPTDANLLIDYWQMSVCRVSGPVANK